MNQCRLFFLNFDPTEKKTFRFRFVLRAQSFIEALPKPLTTFVNDLQK